MVYASAIPVKARGVSSIHMELGKELNLLQLQFLSNWYSRAVVKFFAVFKAICRQKGETSAEKSKLPQASAAERSRPT